MPSLSRSPEEIEQELKKQSAEENECYRTMAAGIDFMLAVQDDAERKRMNRLKP